MKALVLTSVDGSILVVARPFIARKHGLLGSTLIFSPAPGDFAEVKETVEQIASAVGANPVGGRA